MNSAQRTQRVSELQALGRLMGDPSGRRWLYNHLAALHVFSTSFASNALVMAHSEGERNAGLRLISEAMEANADMYLQMLKETTGERPQTNGVPGSDTDADSESVSTG